MPPITKVDRSRMAAYDDCRRLRYLRYHWGGSGLSAVTAAKPLLDGTFVHIVCAAALSGGDVEQAMTVAEMTYAAEGGDPAGVFRLRVLLDLWQRRRLPAIMAEYDVLEVEQEHIWPMSPDLHDMVRCDALLRRRADKALFLQEFKTTRAFSPAWSAQWTMNTQLLANLQAMEAIWREPIEGVLIEGLLKAPYLDQAWRDADGRVHLKGHRSWTRVSVPEDLGLTAAEWLAHPAWSDLDRDALFNPQEARRPVTRELRRWWEQAVRQERQIAADVAICAENPAEVDRLFPLNYNHCLRYFSHPCEFFSLCHSGEIERDPIGSLMYEPRTPHHDEEGTHGLDL